MLVHPRTRGIRQSDRSSHLRTHRSIRARAGTTNDSVVRARCPALRRFIRAARGHNFESRQPPQTSVGPSAHARPGQRAEPFGAMTTVHPRARGDVRQILDEWKNVRLIRAKRGFDIVCVVGHGAFHRPIRARAGHLWIRGPVRSSKLTGSSALARGTTCDVRRVVKCAIAFGPSAQRAVVQEAPSAGRTPRDHALGLRC